MPIASTVKNVLTVTGYKAIYLAEPPYFFFSSVIKHIIIYSIDVIGKSIIQTGLTLSTPLVRSWGALRSGDPA